jgi:hypothetical protein
MNDRAAGAASDGAILLYKFEPDTHPQRVDTLHVASRVQRYPATAKTDGFNARAVLSKALSGPCREGPTALHLG